jgi:hypothetical protein
LIQHFILPRPPSITLKRWGSTQGAVDFLPKPTTEVKLVEGGRHRLTSSVPLSEISTGLSPGCHRISTQTTRRLVQCSTEAPWSSRETSPSRRPAWRPGCSHVGRRAHPALPQLASESAPRVVLAMLLHPRVDATTLSLCPGGAAAWGVTGDPDLGLSRSHRRAGPPHRCA